VQITVIKKDGTDMTVKEFRDYAKWLTGARVDSWLDMYVGNEIAYSFLGKFTNLEQYKYDARTIGFRLTFSSVSPWAFSKPIHWECNIGQSLSVVEENNEVIVVKKSNDVNGESNASVDLGIDNNGVLRVDSEDINSCFNIDEYNIGTLNYESVAYIDTTFRKIINNESDDLYTYIYLDIEYVNKNSDEIYIENKTLGEETIIKGIDNGEIISISDRQFIVSYRFDSITKKRVRNTDKIFGNNFNFVWPRLKPGFNDFSISGSGAGVARFTYRYPMKIGDCDIDIDVNGSGINCGCDCSGSGGNGGSGSEVGGSCSVDANALASMLNRVLG
jgi:hypothetical protein